MFYIILILSLLCVAAELEDIKSNISTYPKKKLPKINKPLSILRRNN